MSQVSLAQRLAQASHRSMLTVGLDPDPTRLPSELRSKPDGVLHFCRAIVDNTAPFVNGFKPQIAYFAALGAEDQLEALCLYIRERHPKHLLVLDAKRGDIGSTAEQYAREAFERYNAHAVTVNPYMGSDSLAPYLEWRDRGIFVLCRTSNAGGDDLQMQELKSGERLFERVARLAAERWNQHGQCGLVVGATYPDEIARVRQIVGPDMPLLVPGIGAQGGDIESTVKAAGGRGLMINSSRAILYASSGSDWLRAASGAAQATCEAIEKVRHALQGR
jgi:orotidine-5'-phosphate decarboxylase